MKSVVFFLLFYECLCHQKKNIINENIITQREHNGINYEQMPTNYENLGVFLEILLFGKSFDPKIILKNEENISFLNEEIYLEKNFDKLHKLYSYLENNYSKMKSIKKVSKDKKKFLSDISEKSSDIQEDKKEEESEEEGEDEEGEEKEGKSPLLFHDLFAKYGNFTEEDKERNINNLEFQRFLFLFNKRKKRVLYTP